MGKGFLGLVALGLAGLVLVGQRGPTHSPAPNLPAKASMPSTLVQQIQSSPYPTPPPIPTTQAAPKPASPTQPTASQAADRQPPPPPPATKPKELAKQKTTQTVLTAAAIAAIIVAASRQAYYARGKPCACPDDRMRNGRSCGSKSAYSRPGGAAPLCYPSDVSTAMIEQYRSRAASR